MMLVVTFMPYKYNDIHACDDSFGCHLHLQPALGSKLRFYDLIHIYVCLSLKAYGLENHPSLQGCVVEGVAYVLSLVSSLISIFLIKIIIMHFLGWMMTLDKINTNLCLVC